MWSFTNLHAADAIPASTTDESAPFVKMLEAQYDSFREAARQGDVEGYKRTRTADTIAFMEAHLKKLGKLDEFGSMIQNMASYGHNYQEFRFISCEAADGTARLSYMRDSQLVDASGQPRVEFLIIMFHQEDGSWKIGYGGHMGVPKVREDGATTTLADVLKGDERWQLPHR